MCSTIVPMARSADGARGIEVGSMRLAPLIVVDQAGGLRRIAEAMMEAGVPYALLDGKRLITDWEMLVALSNLADLSDSADLLVGEKCSYVMDGTRAREATAIMVERATHHLVVLDLSGRPLGVLTARDLLEAWQQTKPAEETE